MFEIFTFYRILPSSDKESEKLKLTVPTVTLVPVGEVLVKFVKRNNSLI
jgi:hypothetical protein